ncbi:MAG TPA: ThuA domain-containing protein [Verrucomicrobiae bacterium]|nr:ThuA domain-containing protein [Verrucomicrobiae bacterium]
MSSTIKALVSSGDEWHSTEMVRSGLTSLADPGFNFTFLDDDTAWSAARLNGFQLVVLTKTNMISPQDKRPWLTVDSDAAFRDFVRRGSGLVAVHGGIAGYNKLPAMRGIIGGAFLLHPPQCLVTIEPKSGHPLTSGIEPFTVADEHYQVTLDDPRADVFLHSRSEHGLQPAGWTRAEGEGRVCVLTPGHNPGVWLHPYFQILLRNALRWAAKI